jgi:saccharopine dehydrogenase-like NADP-dependent oxidoreductase
MRGGDSVSEGEEGRERARAEEKRTTCHEELRAAPTAMLTAVHDLPTAMLTAVHDLPTAMLTAVHELLQHFHKNSK